MNGVIETKDVWVVWTNTDLTEGRGAEFPLYVCEVEATAIRLCHKVGVMGSDGRVSMECLVCVDGEWYGPCRVLGSTMEDDKTQEVIDERRVVIERARNAGLTEDDIKILTR